MHAITNEHGTVAGIACVSQPTQCVRDNVRFCGTRFVFGSTTDHREKRTELEVIQDSDCLRFVLTCCDGKGNACLLERLQNVDDARKYGGVERAVASVVLPVNAKSFPGGFLIQPESHSKRFDQRRADVVHQL